MSKTFINRTGTHKFDGIISKEQSEFCRPRKNNASLPVTGHMVGRFDLSGGRIAPCIAPLILFPMDLRDVRCDSGCVNS